MGNKIGMTKQEFNQKISETFGPECVQETDNQGRISIKTNLKWDKEQANVVPNDYTSPKA